eukprot:TRINITY_DN1994_c0_g1_i1.p1 TRINITY_DN1994_c0_g1~~TRINITY_DN1994_c0_g1_i1.p1  ORF type:complete len:261 (+),score=48.56 TRINITY_DN1994_c0_g1_i1:165-947(+)
MENTSSNEITEELTVIRAMFPDEFISYADQNQIALKLPEDDNIPSITLRWSYPTSYPDCPVFSIEGSWLTNQDVQTLSDQLARLFQEVNGPIIFRWIDWLKDHTYNQLNLRARDFPKPNPPTIQHVPSSPPTRDLQDAPEVAPVVSPTLTRDALQGLSSDEEEGTQEKIKLRTSEDVFNRIRWDESYNKEDFIIAYIDRFDGMQELSFPEWEARADDMTISIPWHRVQFFKHAPTSDVVWDRRTREDYIFGDVKKGLIAQ